MKASDIMSSPVISVRPDTSVREIARLLFERHISGVPVLEDERLVGVVSEADVLRRHPPGGPARRASDIMTHEVRTVAPETPVGEIAALLEGHGIKRAPVLEAGRLVGIVSRSNLVQALAVAGSPEEPRPDDDDAIRASLLAALKREPWWWQGDSNVIVTDGVVHYWGALQPEAQRAAAHAVAQDIPGVRRVEDHRFAARERPAPQAASEIRRAQERGHSERGWVDSYHSFSFGNYYDPAYMGYGPLHAINEKLVQAGGGSTTYGLRDVEVVAYVLDGELGHDDSLDNNVTLFGGGVQRLSAGSGVRFSETNRSASLPCRFLQIWVEPDRAGLRASYEHKQFPAEEKRGCLRLIASPDGGDGSLSIHREMFLYAGLFGGTERAELRVKPDRKSYVHVARGRITVNGHALGEGDALKTGGETLAFQGGQGAEVLVFEFA